MNRARSAALALALRRARRRGHGRAGAGLRRPARLHRSTVQFDPTSRRSTRSSASRSAPAGRGHAAQPDAGDLPVLRRGGRRRPTNSARARSSASRSARRSWARTCASTSSPRPTTSTTSTRGATTARSGRASRTARSPRPPASPRSARGRPSRWITATPHGGEAAAAEAISKMLYELAARMDCWNLAPAARLDLFLDAGPQPGRPRRASRRCPHVRLGVRPQP